jgi:hypothetical protein
MLRKSLRVSLVAGGAVVALTTALSTSAWATAGPTTNNNITFYVNGTARSVNYALNEIAPPCGDYVQTIVGGPYNNSYVGNQGNVCATQTHPYQVGSSSTTYNYKITGAGHDAYSSGSVTFTVS